MLAPGDEILDYDGNTPLTVISNVLEETTERVCNFEVEGTHTYFAADVVAWVHNAGGGRGRPAIPGDPFSPTSVSNRQKLNDILYPDAPTDCIVGAPPKLDKFELEKTTLGRILDALGVVLDTGS